MQKVPFSGIPGAAANACCFRRREEEVMKITVSSDSHHRDFAGLEIQVLCRFLDVGGPPLCGLRIGAGGPCGKVGGFVLANRTLPKLSSILSGGRGALFLRMES